MYVLDFSSAEFVIGALLSCLLWTCFYACALLFAASSGRWSPLLHWSNGLLSLRGSIVWSKLLLTCDCASIDPESPLSLDPLEPYSNLTIILPTPGCGRVVQMALSCGSFCSPKIPLSHSLTSSQPPPSPKSTRSKPSTAKTSNSPRKNTTS